MNNLTDPQLLREYTERRSEAAFAELVRRHVDFVYSAALRMVHDGHLAEDVTQSVFVALARNTRQLTDHPVLAGWLHRTAQNLAANTVRSDVRRRDREQKAAAMNELISTEPDTDWEQIAPHLDAALGELSEPDRDALLLRYFQDKSAREMAQILDTSEDAAQKRVSRAVDRLWEFFAKRGVTVGASGLVVVISANAVQAAPAGLAATIASAVVLTGTTTVATTTATITKAIAMTALQKTLITATIAAAIGAGIYEGREASMLRTQVETGQQRQALLDERIQQLTRSRDAAISQLNALRDENEHLGRGSAELLKLRGENARLRNEAQALQQMNATGVSTDTVAKHWLARVNQLKNFVEQSPGESIPEFRFLTDREWLTVADAGLKTEDFEDKEDYRRAMESLRLQAEGRFGNLVQIALNKYSAANNEEFPNDLSQLRPYCDPAVEEMLLQLYEIKPADVLPAYVVQDLNVKVEWVITRKERVNSNSTSRLAIFAHGNAYWQSPPGSDNP